MSELTVSGLGRRPDSILNLAEVPDTGKCSQSDCMLTKPTRHKCATCDAWVCNLCAVKNGPRPVDELRLCFAHRVLVDVAEVLAVPAPASTAPAPPVETKECADIPEEVVLETSLPDPAGKPSSGPVPIDAALYGSPAGIKLANTMRAECVRVADDSKLTMRMLAHGMLSV